MITKVERGRKEGYWSAWDLTTITYEIDRQQGFTEEAKRTTNIFKHL